jgi:hypothetical protein
MHILTIEIEGTAETVLRKSTLEEMSFSAK